MWGLMMASSLLAERKKGVNRGKASHDDDDEGNEFHMKNSHEFNKLIIKFKIHVKIYF
jgi:hypothetical protein